MRVLCRCCMLLLTLNGAPTVGGTPVRREARDVAAMLRRAAHQPETAALNTLLGAEREATRTRSPQLLRDTLDAEYRLAQTLYHRGANAGCRRVLEHALPMMRQAGPSYHGTPAANLLMGDAALQQQDFSTALEDYTEALAEQMRTTPASTAEGITRLRLGDLAFRQEDAATAKGEYSRALAIALKRSHASPLQARAVDGLARVAAFQHKYSLSRQLFEREYDLWRQLPGHRAELAAAANDLYEETLAAQP